MQYFCLVFFKVFLCDNYTCIIIIGGINIFEISKYKKSNVKISIRLPENMNEMLKKIAKKENMSFNNVIVSCIQNSLDEMELDKYKNVDIYDDKELKV